MSSGFFTFRLRFIERTRQNSSQDISYSDQLAEHWASIPKVVGWIPTVVRHIFQLARCGYRPRVTPYTSLHNKFQDSCSLKYTTYYMFISVFCLRSKVFQEDNHK